MDIKELINIKGSKEPRGVNVDDFRLAINSENAYLTPIALNEEWILKYGFTLMPENEYTLYTYELDGFQLWNKNGEFSEIEYLTNRESILVKYVHQLQNLFFALKGKDIEYSNF
ncbi:hypothetical protein [Chryseobacterium polytrichastri]|uniref:Uncharacterized protein n=1 Tax=Chryseobacterium polytrichastri TaxID=1302687 RepID=A0A1M6VSR5_9FLAO|nr:hypothetical protein [Chryseobacterium polytrichastri]SHK84573.1 hypothetical protein SAMN05444267_1008134 [Chryseobacterium polytrichastri]